MNLCLSKSIKTVPLPKKYIEIKSIASSSINFLIVIGHSTDHETSRIARMLMAPGILRKFIDFSVHREIRNVAYHNKCAVLTIVNPSFYTMTDYPVTDLLYDRIDVSFCNNSIEFVMDKGAAAWPPWELQ